MVSLVSSNSVFLAHGQTTLAIIGGFCISALWWSSSSSKRPDARWGWFVYATGAAAGTWTGAAVAHWLM